MEQVTKTFQENCHKAVGIIKTAVKLIANADWGHDIKQAHVILIKFFKYSNSF